MGGRSANRRDAEATADNLGLEGPWSSPPPRRRRRRPCSSSSPEPPHARLPETPPPQCKTPHNSSIKKVHSRRLPSFLPAYMLRTCVSTYSWTIWRCRRQGRPRRNGGATRHRPKIRGEHLLRRRKGTPANSIVSDSWSRGTTECLLRQHSRFTSRAGADMAAALGTFSAADHWTSSSPHRLPGGLSGGSAAAARRVEASGAPLDVRDLVEQAQLPAVQAGPQLREAALRAAALVLRGLGGERRGRLRGSLDFNPYFGKLLLHALHSAPLAGHHADGSVSRLLPRQSSPGGRLPRGAPAQFSHRLHVAQLGARAAEPPPREPDPTMAQNRDGDHPEEHSDEHLDEPHRQRAAAGLRPPVRAAGGHSLAPERFVCAEDTATYEDVVVQLSGGGSGRCARARCSAGTS